MLDFENNANPYDDQKEATAEWKNLSDEFVNIYESIREKTRKLKHTA